MFSISQDFKGTNRGIISNQFPFVQNQQAVGHGDHVFQAVLTDENGGTQFPVNTAQGLEKIRGRNGHER